MTDQRQKKPRTKRQQQSDQPRVPTTDCRRRRPRSKWHNVHWYLSINCYQHFFSCHTHDFSILMNTRANHISVLPEQAIATLFHATHTHFYFWCIHMLITLTSTSKTDNVSFGLFFLHMCDLKIDCLCFAAELHEHRREGLGREKLGSEV